MEREIARVNAWMARRYGARGAKDPEIVLEVQRFPDVLLRDLEIETRRTRGTFREWLTPYVVTDYEGVVEEFLERSKKRREEVNG